MTFLSFCLLYSSFNFKHISFKFSIYRYLITVVRCLQDWDFVIISEGDPKVTEIFFHWKVCHCEKIHHFFFWILFSSKFATLLLKWYKTKTWSNFCCVWFREQQKSRDLDIMTGFQVMDGDKHVFVLEGLRDRAISYIWENVPAPENSGKKNGVSSGITSPLKDLFTRKKCF